MYIDFNSKTQTELIDLLKNDILTAGQRKLVAKKLNDDYGLIDSIVYISTDSHPHYVKDIDCLGKLGLNLLYGEKNTSQKSKRPFYWIDYHGKRRKSFHKGGTAKIYVAIDCIDRIAGRRVCDPVNPNNFLDKNLK